MADENAKNASAEKPEANAAVKQDEGFKAHDVVDESAAKRVYLADLGHTLTSHGDGSPTVSPDLVARRAELKEHNAHPDRDNEALAKQLNK